MNNALSAAVAAISTAAFACVFTSAQDPPRGGPGEVIDWRIEEKTTLANHVQLTFADRFFKAGEAYFSPNGDHIIFQAVEQPGEGELPSNYYAMFVADLVRNADGRITGIDNIRRVSPEGSANTCGWFHPTDPNLIIFGSSVGEPTEAEPPGFQRSSGQYRWMFPPEMRIVQADLRTADGTAESLTVVSGTENAYQAECSFSPDGRHLLFCSLEDHEGDLFVTDLKTGVTNHIVSAPGYDGGPFFSPDGTRICYRSDRRGDNELQLFVSELKFDDRGTIIGVEREFQLTNGHDVNWAPFWHPDGTSLIYTTSELGHWNYEVFIIDADPGAEGPTRYGTNRRRITAASGFDGLPVFSTDGSQMMWTSQRGADGGSQLWIADFLAAE